MDDKNDLQPIGLPSVVMPVVTAGLALLAGVVLGGVGGWMAKPPDVQLEEVPRELSEAELTEACEPKVAETATNLEDANFKVAALSKQVDDKEAKVKELEAEMARRAEKGAAIRRELEQARADLAQAKSDLAVAIEEKEALVVELTQTKEALEDQKEQTVAAKEEATDQRWNAFLADAQLDICEKGNRQKLGKCREQVAARLDAEMAGRYRHCIRAGQEPPSLHQAGKDEQLPEFAVWMDQESKVLRDYYVLLCDPTLPEAEEFAMLASPMVDGADQGAIDELLDGEPQ